MWVLNWFLWYQIVTKGSNVVNNTVNQTTTQWAHVARATSNQRLCNLMTLYWRWCDVALSSSRCTDVDATLYKCHDIISTLIRRYINVMCLQGKYNLPKAPTDGETKNNKRQKDCLWKQRIHYGIENKSLGFIETFHKQKWNLHTTVFDLIT